MRCAIFLLGLLALAGCARTSPPRAQTQTSSSALPVAHATPPAPTTAAQPPTQPKVDPVRPAVVDEKFTWELPGGALKWIETSRAVAHKLSVVMKAPPGSLVSIAVVLQPDLETAKQDLMMGMDPKKKLASAKLTDKADLEADVPAGQAYAIILRNHRDEAVTLDLSLKAP